MLSSRWPTENKLKGIFGGSLFHNAMSGLFLVFNSVFLFQFILLISISSFSLFNPTGPFHVHLSLSIQCFVGFLNLQTARSLFLGLSLGLFFFFVLSYSNVLVQFYLSVFYFIIIITQTSILMIDRLEVNPALSKGGGSRRRRGRNYNQVILCEKSPFSIKKKLSNLIQNINKCTKQ